MIRTLFPDVSAMQPMAVMNAMLLGAAAVCIPAVASAAENFPVYPGATRVVPRQTMPTVTKCGHKLTLVSYHVAADGRAVAAWYGARESGRRKVVLENDQGTNGNRSTEFMSPDGDSAVIVMQMQFDPRLAAAAKTIGADKTSIAFETFDPPLGRDFVDVMLQAKGGDSIARHAARLKMAAICPNP